MGPSQQAAQSDPGFPMQRYLNQGLSSQQVLMIRQVFDSYLPHQGRIESAKYRESLQQSELREVAASRLGDKQSLDFDEFFAIEKEVLLAQLKKNPGMEVDSTQVEPPSNVLCPYAQEVVRH
jgi:hypothetical protein